MEKRLMKIGEAARLYGSRSKKHKNMMKALEDAAGTQG